MPESILHWGLGLITAIQRLHGPFLDGFFRAISALGEEPFYLLVLPLVLWCLDFGLGARLGVVFLLSSYLNVGLKDIFRQPRPFDLDPAVKLAPVTGYGLPSGHAQSSIVGWGFLAMQARRRAVWIIAGALILLIGFSRIYLGLHFPTDVLGGWIIGLLVLWVFLGLEPAATRHLAHLGLAGRIGLAILLPAALFLLHPTADTATALGTLAGFGAGLALEQRFVRFAVGGPWTQRSARFVLGAAVVLLLFLGLKLVFPGEGAPYYPIFRLVRYAAIGLWVSFGAPWSFCRLGLAFCLADARKID